jgi:two-component system response regulator ChvI
VAAEYAALDLGAVDFVDKARGIAILAKRLRMIVESHRAPTRSDGSSASGPEPIQRGKLTLHTDIARAYWDGVDLELTLTEFKIVFLLVSRAGEYVTYRGVYDCVRYSGFVAGNGEDGFRTNVRSSIKRIRNKFRQLDDGFSEIENYAAFGYRWHGAAAGVG